MNESESAKYIRSLRDPVKRRFAVAYHQWILAGRVGAIPARGALAPALAKAVCLNLDSLS
ncbi:MAG: hypothetical protein ACOYON_08670 [Fimbriimonas sp.]